MNVFYNRDEEIEFLKGLVDEEQTMKQKGDKDYQTWLIKKQCCFHRISASPEKNYRRGRKSEIIRTPK